MAETPAPQGHPYEVALFLAAILLVLFALWWVRGGPEKVSVQKPFLFAPTVKGTPTPYSPQKEYSPPTYSPPYTY